VSDAPRDRKGIGLPVYLALVNFILTALGIAGGTLWSLSGRLSESRYAAVDNNRQIVSLHGSMVDVDRRLNEATTREAEIRRTMEASLADQREHISVLEAQMKFVADRVPPAPLPGGVRR
jgi:hypothetical protein